MYIIVSILEIPLDIIIDCTTLCQLLDNLSIYVIIQLSRHKKSGPFKGPRGDQGVAKTNHITDQGETLMANPPRNSNNGILNSARTIEQMLDDVVMDSQAECSRAYCAGRDLTIRVDGKSFEYRLFELDGEYRVRALDAQKTKSFASEVQRSVWIQRLRNRLAAKHSDKSLADRVAVMLQANMPNGQLIRPDVEVKQVSAHTWQGWLKEETGRRFTVVNGKLEDIEALINDHYFAPIINVISLTRREEKQIFVDDVVMRAHVTGAPTNRDVKILKEVEALPEAAPVDRETLRKDLCSQLNQLHRVNQFKPHTLQYVAASGRHRLLEIGRKLYLVRTGVKAERAAHNGGPKALVGERPTIETPTGARFDSGAHWILSSTFRDSVAQFVDEAWAELPVCIQSAELESLPF